jgi:hypothetical protein
MSKEQETNIEKQAEPLLTKTYFKISFFAHSKFIPVPIPYYFIPYRYLLANSFVVSLFLKEFSFGLGLKAKPVLFLVALKYR